MEKVGELPCPSSLYILYYNKYIKYIRFQEFLILRIKNVSKKKNQAYF